MLQTNSSNNKFYNNSFTAIANGTQRTAAFKNSGGLDSRENILNNTFLSNRRWIYILTEEGETTDPLTLSNNTWKTLGTVDSPFYPFETSGIGGAFSFVDNKYGTGDQTLFESACFGNSTNLISCNPSVNMTITNTSSYFISDFINLISNWLQHGTNLDMNSDAIINSKDLGIMMSKWN